MPITSLHFVLKRAQESSTESKWVAQCQESSRVFKGALTRIDVKKVQDSAAMMFSIRISHRPPIDRPPNAPQIRSLRKPLGRGCGGVKAVIFKDTCAHTHAHSFDNHTTHTHICSSKLTKTTAEPMELHSVSQQIDFEQLFPNDKRTAHCLQAVPGEGGY